MSNPEVTRATFLRLLLLAIIGPSCASPPVNSVEPVVNETLEAKQSSEADTKAVPPWDDPEMRATDLLGVARSKSATIVVGRQGAIFRTTADNRWQKIESGTSADLTAIYGEAGGSFWIVGRSATVLHSSDDGQTFSPINTEDFLYSPYQISKMSWTRIAGNGRGDILLAGKSLMVGTSRVTYSRDSGATWSRDVYLAGDINGVTTTPQGDILVSNSTRHPHGGYFGVTLTRLSASDVIRTPEGQEALSGIWSDPTGNVYTSDGTPVALVDKSTAWSLSDKRGGDKVVRWNNHLLVPGEHGGIHHSWDQGKSWAHEAADSDTIISDVQVDSAGLATLVGQGGLIMSAQLQPGPMVWRSLTLASSPARPWVRRDIVSLWSDSERTVLGATPFGRLIRSTDAGLTWHSLADRYGVQRLWGMPADRAGAKGTRIFRVGARIESTTDGGATWIEHSSALRYLFDIHGRGNDVVAVGNSVLVSHDQGSRWKVRKMPVDSVMKAVWVSPEGDYLVAGRDGVILRSTDRGESFQQVSSTEGLEFLSIGGIGKLRIAVGYKGAMVSYDSGETWSPSTNPTWGRAVRILGGVLYVVGFDPSITYTRGIKTGWNSNDSRKRFADIAMAGEALVTAKRYDLFRSTDNGETWVRTDPKAPKK